MIFHVWRRWGRYLFPGSQPKPRRERRRTGSRSRPTIEAFENRLLPSTFTVTDLGDNNVGTGFEGDLRYCINAANANDEASNRIVFQKGLAGTVILEQGVLDVTKDLEIDGPGAAQVTISGNHHSGVFYLTTDSRLQQVGIADLTIADGTGILDPYFGTVYAGGGLYNDHATVTLSRVAISGNELSGFSAVGGGIFNRGTMLLDSCTISRNSAGDSGGNSGGGIANFTGTMGSMTLTNSIVSGNTAWQASAIDNNGILSLDHSIVSDNSSSAGGVQVAPAISSLGSTTIADSTIANNVGEYPSIFNLAGQMTITNSTIAHNTGGGLSNYGSMTLTGSTVSGNVDIRNLAGGIYAFDIGTGHGSDLNITNSTISGNTGPVVGGIRLIGPQESVELTSCTITGNSGAFEGGLAIFFNDQTGASARAVVRNTIIAGNDGGYPDVQGPVISVGYNLIGQTDGSSGWRATDRTGTSRLPLDPRLRPLQDNGGPTLTHAPAGSSPALGNGDPALFSTLDQRGTVRGQLPDTPDIGAVNSARAARFALLAPDPVVQGEPITLTVMALDPWGNRAFTYHGTIRFASSDPDAQLPDNYPFSPDDGGIQSFTVTLNTVGSQSIQVVDTTGFPSGTVTVDVQGGNAPTGFAEPLLDWVFVENDFIAKRLACPPFPTLFQQNGETGLAKMAIRRKSVGNSMLLHYNEGDTIRNGPFLVWTASI